MAVIVHTRKLSNGHVCGVTDTDTGKTLAESYGYGAKEAAAEILESFAKTHGRNIDALLTEALSLWSDKENGKVRGNGQYEELPQSPEPQW